MLAIGVVEVRRALSCELEVLALVFTNWDVGCPIVSGGQGE